MTDSKRHPGDDPSVEAEFGAAPLDCDEGYNVPSAMEPADRRWEEKAKRMREDEAGERAALGHWP